MSDNIFFLGLSKAGGAIGMGLIAGLAGTVAITRWPPKEIATDVIQHGVYATATGLTYDAMKNAEIKKRKRSISFEWVDSLLAGKGKRNTKKFRLNLK